MWRKSNLRSDLHPNEVSMDVSFARKCTNIFDILLNLIGFSGIPFKRSSIKSLNSIFPIRYEIPKGLRVAHWAESGFGSSISSII